MGRFPLAGRDRNDHHVDDGARGPGREVGEPGLLLGFPVGDCERIGLAGVGVAAHLEPGLLSLVPPQQDPGGGRMDHHRRPGEVQRERTAPRVFAGGEQVLYAEDVAGLVLRAREVVAETPDHEQNL